MRILKIILTISFSILALQSPAQTNCNLFDRDSNCHKACTEVEKATMHYAGDINFQKHLLTAIELCPQFHQAYFELSVNYAKRGLMNEWIKLIDRAVEISPKDHLGWRGWYHWFFANNYEKAIEDIERLDDLIQYDLGTTGDGLYHLNILKGLCYKGLNNTKKAIELIEECMKGDEYYQGSYDYLHLGVLYLEENQPQRALDAFKTQNSYNEISEAYFYSAKAHLAIGNTEKAIDLLQLSLLRYNDGKAMHDPYRQLTDEIYKVNIEDALKSVANN